MKLLAAALASLLVGAASSAQAEQPNIAGRRLSPEDVRSVAPALEKYTQERLYGGSGSVQASARGIGASSPLRRSSRAISPCR
jgi:hypothetical protein